MLRVKFNVACYAVYASELELPEDYPTDNESVLEYIHDHLNEASVLDGPEWISDMEPYEAVTIDDLRGIVEE